MKNSGSAQKTSPKQNNMRQSYENMPPVFAVTKEEKEQSKLQHLEVNLNRVCLQQDALMPLLTMIEYIPAIQRTDSVVKGLMRKIEENETKILKSEKLLESKLRDPSEACKDQKKQQKQITDLNKKVQEMEQQMVNLQRWYETKLKEENQTLQRSMEQKIEKSKSEACRLYSNESSKRISTENSKLHSKQPSQSAQTLAQGTMPTQASTDSSQQYQQVILYAVEQIVSQQLNQVKSTIQAQVDQLREDVQIFKGIKPQIQLDA